ncbi:unnamed protein product [Rangifer tarandus platyrhynchus]|uniref:Uncharacterized protein n=1 Tax=Rangifer tarandus platyrhynchus TaxID=3082113 RepID=A0ABN8ZAL9_RANTA|nr:unnamed protein product [Rangifer tarandus platyrhynchus]CAI9689277.1 unnamed protein product [Rangifer tarandus platyrhynchus]
MKRVFPQFWAWGTNRVLSCRAVTALSSELADGHLLGSVLTLGEREREFQPAIVKKAVILRFLETQSLLGYWEGRIPEGQGEPPFNTRRVQFVPPTLTVCKDRQQPGFEHSDSGLFGVSMNMRMTACTVKALDLPVLRIRLVPWPLLSASRRALCCRLLVSEGMAAVRTQQGRLGKPGSEQLGSSPWSCPALSADKVAAAAASCESANQTARHGDFWPLPSRSGWDPSACSWFQAFLLRFVSNFRAATKPPFPKDSFIPYSLTISHNATVFEV